MAIGLDALKPHIMPTEKFQVMYQKKITDFVKFDDYNVNNSEPPSYTIEEMIERWYKGLYLFKFYMSSYPFICI